VDPWRPSADGAQAQPLDRLAGEARLGPRRWDDDPALAYAAGTLFAEPCYPRFHPLKSEHRLEKLQDDSSPGRSAMRSRRSSRTTG
jgi:hypothetical protein